MRTSTGDVYWKIFGTIKKSTDKAYLWVVSRTKQEVWIPKSQTRDLCLVPDEDGDVSILVKEWILNDKSIGENDRFSPNEDRPGKDYKSASEFFENLDDYDDNVPF